MTLTITFPDSESLQRFLDLLDDNNSDIKFAMEQELSEELERDLKLRRSSETEWEFVSDE